MLEKKSNRKIAIIYDFDGTLAPDNMQEHTLFPKYGIDKDEFWKEVRATAKENEMDEILTYMQLLIKEIGKRGVNIKQCELEDHGKHIPFFDGIEANGRDSDWFDRINNYGKECDINTDVEHYIISSGLKEMIDGTPIEKHFTRIFASKYKYSAGGADNIAEWPALAINYTTKTQYLFRINKGITNAWDNTEINEYMHVSKRPIPFSNMIYIGDGLTDIPCMKMIRNQGGHSLAVYNPKSSLKNEDLDKCRKLVSQERADFAVAADYRPDSELETIVRTLVCKIVAEMNPKALRPAPEDPACKQATTPNCTPDCVDLQTHQDVESAATKPV